jgi:hypothetical protein
MHYKDRQQQTGQAIDFGEELGLGQRTSGGDSTTDSDTTDTDTSTTDDLFDFGEELGAGQRTSGGDSTTDTSTTDDSFDFSGFQEEATLSTATQDDLDGSDGGDASNTDTTTTETTTGFGEELGSGQRTSGGDNTETTTDFGEELGSGQRTSGDNTGTTDTTDQTQEQQPDPADIRVMSVGFTSSTLRVGQDETARVRFRNYGGQTGTAERTLLGNGQPLGVVIATVAPGETQVDTIDFTVPQTDRLELSFQDDFYNTAAEKNVEPQPAEGTLSPNIESPNGAMVGDGFNVDVTVEAVGGRVDATESLNVKVGGRTVLADTVGPLSEGEEYRRSISVTAQEAGETPVVLNVGDSQTSDRIQIEPEPTAEFSADPPEVVTNGQPGELTQVRVTVRNTGDGLGNITVPVLVDSVQVASIPFVDVAPGEVASNTASYTTPSDGVYTLALGGFNVSANVEPEQPEQPQGPQQPQQPDDGQGTQPDFGGGAPFQQVGDIIGGFSNRQLAIGAGLAAGAVVLSNLGGG